MQKDLDRVGEWAAENAMKIKSKQMYGSSFHEDPGERPTKLYVRGPINSGSEQLQILGNNLRQRLKLG